MKRAKFLSLLITGSLLFQTAGIDAMASAPSAPSHSIFAEDAENGLAEQPFEENANGKTPDNEAGNPSQPAEEDIHDKASDGEGNNPEQPSGEESKDKSPDKEESNPEQPAGEDSNDKDPDKEDGNPEQPGGEEVNDKAPDREEDDTELSDEEDEEEDASVSEEEENGSSVSENSVSENTVPEDTVSENTVSENTLPEENAASIFSIFPGLGDSYQFSAEEIEDKRVLSAHIGDVVDLSSLETATVEDFRDTSDKYALGEVMYLAETEEEAERVAAAFGGTLDSYAYEVAVISLPEEATVALAIAAAAQPDIKLPAVWPNYYQYLYEDDTYSTVTPLKPSDPGFASQWQHDYIGTRYAWAAGYKGKGVKVAVIDTGLDMGHEDLSVNALQGKNFVGMGKKGTNATAPNQNTDNQTHGTHVAGIIAADDNGKGGIGIAPDAKVAGFCVFPKSGSADTADTIRAIKAAVKDKYDIINMSLGGPGYSKPYEDAVNEAYNAGVAVFAAAGNEDISAKAYPAGFANTISVGAVDQNGTRASFSNYGSSLSLSFPGVSIYSTVPGSYGSMSGTSQASPAAAGTAAVILSAREDIRKKTGRARVNALLSAMKSSTTKCATSGMGAGTTYLPGVLKLATNTTAPETPVINIIEKTGSGAAIPKQGAAYITESINVTLSCKTAVGVDIYYTTDGKTPTYKNGAIANPESTTLYTLGQKISLTGAKSKTIKAIAVNPFSGKVSKLASKTVTLTPIPTGVTVTPAGNVKRVVAGKSLKFTATVAPAYAISNKVQWTVTDASGKEAKGITVSGGTVKTTAKGDKKTAPGEYIVTATAVGSDGKKYNGKKGTFKFTVIETSDITKVAFIDPLTKKAPTAKSIKTGDSKTTDTANQVINLAAYLSVTKTDAKTKVKTELTGAPARTEVVWSSSNAKVAAVSDDGVIKAVTPGKAVIKATSNDGGNKSASYTVTVVQPVTKITVGGPKKVAVGKSIALTATVSPANATNKKLEWTVSGDGKAVSIGKSNGKVSTKKGADGTYTVTAAAADHLGAAAATYTITIENQEITEITFNTNKLTLFPPNTNAKSNTTATLSATIKGKPSGSNAKPGAITTSLITWSSSAPSIATVDQKGKITAKAPGKTTVTCAASDGSNKKASCTVTVSVPMSKLVIGPTDGNLDSKNGVNEACVAVGKKIKMAAKYYSDYGTPSNKTVEWSIVNYSNNTLKEKVKIDKNGTVSVDKKLSLPSGGAYVKVRATAKDGSGVKSNDYRINIKKNYLTARIVWSSANSAFVMQASTQKLRPKTAAWNNSKNWELVSDYCTASLSGSKNCGLKKTRALASSSDPTVYALYLPIPTKTTSKTITNRNVSKECEKMTLTLKMKDGSNLSAKLTFYAVEDLRQKSIRYFVVN